MRPLIRRGRDPVTIVPVGVALKKGDVALFTLGDGRYAVHRIWKLRGGFVRTLGDNCACPEPWFPREQVLGRAVRVDRDGRRIRLDTPAARMLGRAWAGAEASEKRRSAAEVAGHAARKSDSFPKGGDLKWRMKCRRA